MPPDHALQVAALLQALWGEGSLRYVINAYLHQRKSGIDNLAC